MYVRVIFLLLVSIRRRKQRANPTNQVIEEQERHADHHANGDQSYEGDAEQQLLPHRQLAASHGPVRVAADVSGAFLLELLELLGGDWRGRVGFEERAVVLGGGAVVVLGGGLWRRFGIEVFELGLH